MIRCKQWGGQPLEGAWLVTRKLDGVRALRRLPGDRPLSRKGKALQNIAHLRFRDAEVFLGSFRRTIVAVRTFIREVERVRQEHVFELDPPDRRLVVGRISDPTAEDVRRLCRQEVARGNEGVVLRQGDRWVKVVMRPTVDVRVTGVFEGKGKFAGMLGGFETAKGNVGTGKGLTTALRKAMWRWPRKMLVGRIIEVSIKGWTDDGKMRQASFVRLREDK